MTLSPDAIAKHLATLTGWQQRGNAIEKNFDCKNFDGSIAFVNRVATVANERDHHPDINVSWNDVTLTLSSHDVGGLTERDFGLAEAIDRIR